MAGDGGKKINVSEPEGPIDSILSYLKERIESPFLMSFVFSWCIFNRDFLFYFYLSTDHYDYRLLANWDYSFWLPLLVSVLLTLFFSSVSSLLSGWRYFFLKHCISFTKRNKDGFDTVYAQNIEQMKLEKLQSEYADLERNRDSLFAKVNSTREQYERVDSLKLTMNLGELTVFLRDAAKFAILYKIGSFSDSKKSSEVKVLPNSIIKVAILDKTNPNIEIQSFEGTTFEFMTNETFFDWNDADSVDCIGRLLATLAKDNNVICNLNKLGRVRCALIESVVYEDNSVE
ncbi:hypothetical protein [Rheinheimera sp. 1928-s]|uniref:hypothetical protein n=1 Tax=Rheinheimera sp. 1928-s TaxID=3033803 RepID=UPI00263235FF|nr:hypothetical protein [Rheinheimera sp. 1928-s]MDF3127439.1 hypothetical protein [Rheinheimera sp. 1928-s]